MIYKSRFTEIGPAALRMLEKNMLILFNDDAPVGLRDISAMHEISDIDGEIEEGQIINVSGMEYQVVAVGEQVNESFKKLGHCCLIFNGGDKPALPCQIMLKGEDLPADIKVGDYLIIE